MEGSASNLQNKNSGQSNIGRNSSFGMTYSAKVSCSELNRSFGYVHVLADLYSRLWSMTTSKPLLKVPAEVVKAVRLSLYDVVGGLKAPCALLGPFRI